jgi:hypothetical protein
MRHRLACLILALAALCSPIYGVEEARLVPPSDGAELFEGSEVALAGPARTTLADPGTDSEPAPRPVLDVAPSPRSSPPDPVPVRLAIHRFNE